MLTKHQFMWQTSLKHSASGYHVTKQTGSDCTSLGQELKRGRKKWEEKIRILAFSLRHYQKPFSPSSLFAANQPRWWVVTENRHLSLLRQAVNESLEAGIDLGMASAGSLSDMRAELAPTLIRYHARAFSITGREDDSSSSLSPSSSCLHWNLP